MNEKWSPRARYFVLILLVVFLAMTAWYIRALFTPLLIAALFAYVLNPVVDFLEKKTKMTHKTAVNLSYFFTLAALLAIPVTVVPILVREVQVLTSDLSGLPNFVQSLLDKSFVIGEFTLSLSSLGIELAEPLSKLLGWVPENTIKLIEATSRNVAWLLVIIITSYHFINDWDEFREWIFRIPPENLQNDARRLYDQIANIWRIYLRGQIVLVAVLGVIYALAWSAIGLPGALILGALAGLLNIIPELGPFITASLAVAVALMEGSYFLDISNFWFAMLVLGVFMVVNYGKNIWLMPKMFSKSLELHNGVIFAAIIAAIVINGILGVLIVVPLLASAMVVGKYLRRRVLGLPPFPGQDAEEGLGEAKEKNVESEV
ncbi:MAG TPA: AI-2E family transporter [Anaerolineales bacterium]|nr:AI-2E family transporter [Anaerolineales bacterium]